MEHIKEKGTLHISWIISSEREEEKKNHKTETMTLKIMYNKTCKSNEFIMALKLDASH